MDIRRWADVIAKAYAADAKPPLTQELVGRLRNALTAVLDSEAGGVSNTDLPGRLNAALDTFEIDLRSVVGPRIVSLDDATGSAAMKHRSEAGQPLRAFGGQ